MVCSVLSNVVSWNGYPFHSTQATSQALQPMHVVTSMSLQTPPPSARLAPLPGTGPACPEIAFSSNAAVGITSSRFLQLHQEALELRRVRIRIDGCRRELI